MNKKFLAVCLAACLAATSFAQVTDGEKALKAESKQAEDGWKLGSIFGLNFSQTALVNWAAGGENSLALNGIFSAFANYRKGDNTWENTLDIGYGVLNQSDLWIKTDDKIDFSSKYGRKAFNDFYYAALANFKTQFAPGYKDPKALAPTMISNFLAPAYALAAVGLSYQPAPYFSAYLAPATGRLTIVGEPTLVESYGLKAGESTKMEFGGYARVNFTKNDFKNEWLKNVGITTKLDLFSNYLKDPQNIDVSWETLIALKVNQYISINFNTHLLYDADVKLKKADGTLEDEAKIQFKEILGVGFSYKF